MPTPGRGEIVKTIIKSVILETQKAPMIGSVDIRKFSLDFLNPKLLESRIYERLDACSFLKSEYSERAVQNPGS